MPARARNLTTVALTCVMAVLLCLVQTASTVAAKFPEKTAFGIFFTDSNIYTGEIAPESQQPQWEIALAATPTASGCQDWLSADPIQESGGMNLYGYVLGDPINSWDPHGLLPPNVWAGLGGAILGGSMGAISGGGASAIVSGAVGGFVTGFTFNPALGATIAAGMGSGLLGGLSSGLVSEGFDMANGGCFDAEDVLISGAISAATGGIGARVGLAYNPSGVMDDMAKHAATIHNSLIGAAVPAVAESLKAQANAWSGQHDCD